MKQYQKDKGTLISKYYKLAQSNINNNSIHGSLAKIPSSMSKLPKGIVDNNNSNSPQNQTPRTEYANGYVNDSRIVQQANKSLNESSHNISLASQSQQNIKKPPLSIASSKKIIRNPK